MIKEMETNTSAGYRLSAQQERLWAQQQSGDASQYCAACTVFLEGQLDASGLRAALRRIVDRHEILRTTFHRQPGMKVPFQVIHDHSEPAFETVDLSCLNESIRGNRLEELFRRVKRFDFNLEQGPMLRVLLAVLSSDKHVLIICLPALCADFCSLRNLAAEISSGYAAHSEGQTPGDVLQYADVVEWQTDLLQGEDTRAGRQFWREHYRTLDWASQSSLSLPFEVKHPAGTFNVETIRMPVDSAFVSRMEAVCGSQEISSPNLLLACWQVLLSRIAGLPQIMVGCEFDGRKFEELENAIGLFSKCLPLQTSVESESAFNQLARQLKNSVNDAYKWQESFSWNQIESSSNSSGPTLLFPFEYLDLPADRQYEGVTFSWGQQYVCCEGFKLKLSAQRSASGLILEFHFDSSRLERATVEQIAGYFQTLLTAAVENPETPVSQLPLLNEGQRKQLLVQWNQTAAAYPEDRCLHELFEAQVARTPDRVALRFEEQQLSYGEWNQRANQLAHYLRQLGVGPDSLVGLCVERSVEMMVALLAILKAGGAYVPLNADNPKPRLAQQLSGVRVLLTQEKLLPRMPEFAGTTLCLDRDETLWSQQPGSNPQIQTSAENLVYVIYTSGSTGVPKGVGVRHRNLVNYAHFICGWLELEKYPEGLHFATVSTLGADLGNTCIYPALISGGCLHVISYEVSTDSQRWAQYCTEHPVDVLKIVPSHLQALLHSEQAGQVLPRKYLILGGETLSTKLVEKIQQLNPVCEILNHYGPTETTVGSLTLAVKHYHGKDAGSIPIGRPIANTRVYILDGHQQPVPVGVVGELYIAGAGVTAGYVNQPERTAERFLLNPFVTETNPQAERARMYRTGDLARYLPDSKVEFLGRGDDQIKIRGFRIELGEIESVLAHHGSVKQAVVVAKEDERGDKRLLAYVVRQLGSSGSTDDLRAYLKEQLPDYMLPAAIVSLPKLPLNANGKIDRQALPAPEQIQSQPYIAPRTPTEEVVALIWAEVLRRDRISTDDNFFELGGHSLMATQIVSRVREHFRIELAMRVLFERPTVHGVAEAIVTAQQSGAADAESAIVPVARESYRAGRS
jgi:amino acid adenylation domain-containing protein